MRFNSHKCTDTYILTFVSSYFWKYRTKRCRKRCDGKKFQKLNDKKVSMVSFVISYHIILPSAARINGNTYIQENQ